jgi:RNA polymerase sigma-70 factor, ECF subfamily
MTAGERLSFRQVFDEHVGLVWRTLRHLGVPERDLEDVCQEVFIVVHRKLAEFEGRSTVGTWVYGICLRTASDYRRRAHVRREEPTSEVPLSAVQPNQENEVQLQQTRSELARALGLLDEEKRAVFVLYEIEEVDMKAIATIVGCPLQTAYSRLRAARQILSQALGSDKYAVRAG